MLQLVWIPGRCLGRSRCSWERTGEGAVGGPLVSGYDGWSNTGHFRYLRLPSKDGRAEI